MPRCPAYTDATVFEPTHCPAYTVRRGLPGLPLTEFTVKTLDDAVLMAELPELEQLRAEIVGRRVLIAKAWQLYLNKVVEYPTEWYFVSESARVPQERVPQHQRA